MTQRGPSQGNWSISHRRNIRPGQDDYIFVSPLDPSCFITIPIRGSDCRRPNILGLFSLCDVHSDASKSSAIDGNRHAGPIGDIVFYAASRGARLYVNALGALLGGSAA